MSYLFLMKYIYIIFGCLFSGKAQNLVPNSDFETYTLCPVSSSNIENAVPWNPAASTSSTDYYNSCSSIYGVPSHPGGFQYARSGNAYAGLFFLQQPYNNFREYLQVQLINPLVQNLTYYVEFYVNLRNGNVYYPCNNITANFSVTRPYTSTFGLLQPLTPHIVNQGNPIIGDSLNWTKVSGCYTAQGGEEYLTIGNFADDINTQSVGTATNTSSYYYVDDVSVFEITGTCVTSVNELGNNINIDVYPNPTEGKLKLVSDDLKEMENLTLKITDVLGKELVLTDYQKQINISQLETGIYFVSILQGNKTLVTKKVIKE